ncbi:Uncharacterized protein TCM_031050 [Theobroma cacao]|uniref:Uncharacterized protein n=1 Tax=Theobroma cacao TaxID=3641 RepID=A0A061F6M3_THECC|nr:Uncharacterized protein TCM_031050 [Theobroma cacao]
MEILYYNDCTACNSFTFPSQEVSLGLTNLNIRCHDLLTNSLLRHSGNAGKQHLLSSGLSDWENILELSWLENPFASFKINVNCSMMAILGGITWSYGQIIVGCFTSPAFVH